MLNGRLPDTYYYSICRQNSSRLKVLRLAQISAVSSCKPSLKFWRQILHLRKQSNDILHEQCNIQKNFTGASSLTLVILWIEMPIQNTVIYPNHDIYSVAGGFDEQDAFLTK